MPWPGWYQCTSLPEKRKAEEAEEKRKVEQAKKKRRCAEEQTLVELRLDALPRDGEHHRLQHVGGDARGQTADEQALHAVLLKDAIDSAHVSQIGVSGRLLHRLDDAQ